MIIWCTDASNIKNVVKERLHVIVIKIEALGDTTGDYLPGFGIGKYFLGHRKYEP